MNIQRLCILYRFSIDSWYEKTINKEPLAPFFTASEVANPHPG